MSNFKLKPTHAPVKEYYATLAQCAAANFDNEGNVRRAFESLLEKCARSYEWTVVAEYPIPRTGRNPLKVDAAILDAFIDPRSGIVNDPNRPNDPEYIVRLIGQVVTVSLETVKLVTELAALSIDQA